MKNIKTIEELTKKKETVNDETELKEIENELAKRVQELQSENKLVEAQRLLQRTNYDLEMIKEVGYCNGTIVSFSSRFVIAPLCLR